MMRSLAFDSDTRKERMAAFAACNADVEPFVCALNREMNAACRLLG